MLIYHQAAKNVLKVIILMINFIIKINIFIRFIPGYISVLLQLLFIGGSTKCEDQNFTDNSTQNIHTTILCRTVRIGSYKYVPPEKILISPSGIRFGIPLLEDGKD